MNPVEYFGTSKQEVAKIIKKAKRIGAKDSDTYLCKFNERAFTEDDTKQPFFHSWKEVNGYTRKPEKWIILPKGTHGYITADEKYPVL